MSKKVFTRLVLVVGVFFILKIALDLGISFFAAPLIAKKTNVPLEFSHVSIHYLSGAVTINHLRVGGINPESKKHLLDVSQIYVNLSLSKLLSGNIVVEEIRVTHPVFHVDVNKKNQMPAVAWIEKLGKEEPKRKLATAQKKVSPSLVIESLKILDGAFEVSDYSFGDEGHTNLEMKNIKMVVGELNFMSPKLSDFLFEAVVQDKGVFSLDGKADFASPKWSTDLKGKIENIELVDFGSYAKRDGNVEVKSGVFNMESNIQIKKNQLDSSHHVKATDVKAELLTGKMAQEGSAVGAALSIFYQVPKMASTKQEKDYDFTFHVKGSLDNPQFDFSELMAQEMANTMNQLKNIINIEKPVKILEDLKDKGLDTIFGK